MNRGPSRNHVGLVVPPIVLGLVLALLPTTVPHRSADLELSPNRAFPLQEIAIHGVPDDLVGFPLRAVPLAADGQVRGDAVSLHAVRLQGREPAFVAPPHPAGPDAAGRFRIEPEGLTPSTPLVLTIEPLPAAGGQTLRLIADLARTLEAMARAAGGDPDLLRDGPIEEVPLNLLGAAVGLRMVTTAESELAGLDLTWSDRWLAARETPDAVEAFADSLAGLPDRIGELPERPPEVTGDRTEATEGHRIGALNRRENVIDNAIDDVPSFATRTKVSAPGPFRLAGAGASHASHPAPSIPAPATSTARDPWEKVDICSRCPGELDYWMDLQAELAQGYGGLLERMARDRDLFDFMSSLEAPADEDTRALGDHLSKAADHARAAAGNPLDDLIAPGAKRGLALAEAVKGVFEQTIELNDKFLISLLPSELLPSSVSVIPARFNEDDTRAEIDGPGSGTWTLRVTARSDVVTFSTADVLRPVPLVGDKASKLLSAYEKARDLAGLEPGDAGLPDPGSELITYGPYFWVGIDVSEPKWSAARALGSCVRVMARDHPSQASQWSQLSYLPQDPASSWGLWADRRIPPEIGIKPAAVGDCDVRISTRVDRFGDAAPLHVDVPVGVDAIRVLVTPSPITVEPGEVRMFEPTVQFADSVEVGWSEQSGSGIEVACPSGESGRPCYEWTAPELDVGECRRPVRITATSLARRGLRESGEPVREGFGAVQVVDPNADLRVNKEGSRSDECLEEYAFMAAGSSGSGDGPSPADIDAPLPIELDSLQGIAGPDVTPMARNTLSDPCALQLVMRNSDWGDAVYLQLTHDGPIGPGAYEVHRIESRRERLRSQEHPGAFYVEFVIGEQNPMSGGRAQSFRGQSGTVMLDSVVVAGLVQGRARVDGYSAPVWIPPPDGGPTKNGEAFGPSNLSIEVEFAVLVHNPQRRIGHKGPIACLADGS